VKRFGNDVTKYDLTCEFTDAAGAGHEAWFTVRETRDGYAPPVPPAVAAALRAGRVPFDVGVSYDPRWPDRNWVRGSGWDDNDRLHYFSLLPLVFQVITLPVFAALLRSAAQGGGTLPWWHDLYKAYPMLIEAGCLLLFGTIELLVRAH
jgi:hypothetical protein